MTIRIPADAMVVLVGPSGSGKSTFAARHFALTEILSSDAMRAMVADDPNDQAATEAAFELLHTALGLRLARRRLTVVDATNVERWARAGLLAIARRHHRPAAAIAFALPVAICLDRNAMRLDTLPPVRVLVDPGDKFVMGVIPARRQKPDVDGVHEHSVLKTRV